jgi:dihydroorotase
MRPVPSDLIIRNARLLDPGSARDGHFDVAVTDGRVSAIDDALDPAEAGEVVDGSGLLLTPGLVDLHTHVFHGVSYGGIDPDTIAGRSGVTTWVDAGSAGCYSLAGLQATADRALARIVALVNISAVGLVAESYELHALENLDPESVRHSAAEHPELVRGIKVRLDRRTTGKHGLEPLHRALDAGDRATLPVMVHIGQPPPAVPDILALLRPGDIVTHCASGLAVGTVDEDGRLGEAMRAGHDRGIVYDVGHGYAGFAFDVAEAMLAAGAGPDVISSDLHARSVHGPAFDLPTVLAKLLALGMPLGDTIAAATVVPARVLGLDAGTLAVGKPADLALWKVADGDFEVYDVHGQCRVAPLRLDNVGTYVGGELLPRRDPDPAPWWVPDSTPVPRRKV